ncbi:hypothetical protein B0H19DRAFT_1274996 [Mycena capillaripes]|nr:hypothetical protein B0H19DRAFT_1274996 [Mycena capillaripes]
MTRQPSVFRALFTDSAEFDKQSDTESISPRSSPIHPHDFSRDPVTPQRATNANTNLNSAPSTLVNSAGHSEVDSPIRTRPQSPRGLVRSQHLIQGMNLNEAMQEISCEYNVDLPAIYSIFAWGISAPAIAGSVSPRAVFRTWSEDAGQPEPFWVKYHQFGYAIRGVSTDFAIGRVFLLAYCPGNISVSNDLLKWAAKFNPNAHQLPAADLRFLSSPAPEDEASDSTSDSEDEDSD